MFQSPMVNADSEVQSKTGLLSAQIDRLVDEAQKREGIIPAPRSTDAEFLRRVTLDLTEKYHRSPKCVVFLPISLPGNGNSW